MFFNRTGTTKASKAGAGDFLNIMVGSGLKVTASKDQMERMPTVGKSKARQAQLSKLVGGKKKWKKKK